MNNFEWNYFGVLSDIRKLDGMVFITNTSGKTLQMSIAKYKESAYIVYEKSLRLKNKKVNVRTSKNTSNWSVDKWFSEIEEM